MKQGLADGLFQQLELPADGLRGKKQCFGRSGNAAFTCNGPEVKQVIVVQVSHRAERLCASRLQHQIEKCDL
jgi:hypothetical protein